MAKITAQIPIYFFIGFLLAGSYKGKTDQSGIHLLKYDMAAGSKFLVTGKNFYERETVLPDGALTGNTIEHEAECQFEVKSTGSDRGLDLNMAFQKITCEKNNPGGTFHEAFSDLTGHAVDVLLSPEGDLSGLEVFNNLPQKDVLLQLSDPSGFLHRANNVFPHLPDHPVGPGDTWMFRLDRERPMMRGARSKIISVHTYTLMEYTTKDGIPCAKIEASYTQTSRTEIEGGRGQVVCEYSGKGKETILFAYEKGMFLSKQGYLDMEGSWGESPQTDRIEYTFSTRFDR